MDNRLIFRSFLVFVLSWGVTMCGGLGVQVIGLLSVKPEGAGKSAFSLLSKTRIKVRRKSGDRVKSMYPRKASQLEYRKFVPKPTLVDWSSRLR